MIHLDVACFYVRMSIVLDLYSSIYGSFESFLFGQGGTANEYSWILNPEW